MTYTTSLTALMDGDQHQAACSDTGREVGAYYRGLTESGVPPDVAASLTHDYAELWVGNKMMHAAGVSQADRWEDDA